MAAIFLRSFGADSNAAGSASFVAIPVPAGGQVGDLVIVGISLPLTGVTVTPPDSSWTQVLQTDPSQALGIVCFTKSYLNEPANWVFALSSACQAAGCCAVYANADGFSPVEMSAAAITAASATHSLPAITASQNGEEVVALLAAGTSGTYTPANNLQMVVRKQQANATLEVQRKGLQAAGNIAAFTETFSASTAGAAILLTLAPSYGTMTVADVYGRLFNSLPLGIDNFLDFTPGVGDFWNFFTAIASTMKLFAFDLVDLARLEVVPYLSRFKLPNWEQFFALTLTRTALLGTIPQRQAQVLAAWRAAAAQSSSMAVVRSALGPVLGYLPSTTLQIIECDRSELQTRNSYEITNGLDVSIPTGQTTTLSTLVIDGGIVAKMGAQLHLVFANTTLTSYTFVLTAPDGTSFTWTGTWSDVPLELYAQKFAGAQIQGIWTLAITNSSGVSNTLFSGSYLFVEGMQRGQQTAGAIFDWGIYVDPAHLGESGTPADLAAARRLIQRLGHQHSIRNVIQSLAPWPNVDSGVHAAIPDECIPT